jgi:preprotein translocase subunit SecE
MIEKIKNYFQETYTELVEKVSWPTWPELQSSAVVVMIASLIIAIMILAMDTGFKFIMENLYKLIQVPLLVGILYFAFQLPVTRKYILKFVPSVFNADGNFNISGLVFMSALFALGYFGLTKLLDCVETL